MSAAVALPPVPTLEKATKELTSARVEEELALDNVRKTKAALDASRQAFSATPSPELDAEIEKAESLVRSGERLADARRQAREQAEQVHASAMERAAAERRTALSQQRYQLRFELRAAFEQVVKTALVLDKRIASIEELVDRDHALATELGVEPLNEEVVRLALGKRLTRDFAMPPAPEGGKVDLTPFVQALAIIESPGTLADQRDRLRSAHNELRMVCGSELADWLRLESRHADAWSDHSPNGERIREAERLLGALEQLEGPGQ